MKISRKRLCTVVLFGTIFCFGELLAGSDYFVAASTAPVYKEASRKSQTTAKLPMGTKLEVQGKKGLWLQINNNSNPGWVHRMFTSKKNPQGEKKGFMTAFKTVIKKYKADDNQNRKRATVMGIRGLDEEGDLNNMDIEPDFDTVNKLDTDYRVVPLPNIMKFLSTVN